MDRGGEGARPGASRIWATFLFFSFLSDLGHLRLPLIIARISATISRTLTLDSYCSKVADQAEEIRRLRVTLRAVELQRKEDTIAAQRKEDAIAAQAESEAGKQDAIAELLRGYGAHADGLQAKIAELEAEVAALKRSLDDTQTATKAWRDHAEKLQAEKDALGDQNEQVLYYTIPYYTIIYHTIPYFTILYQKDALGDQNEQVARGKG